MKSKLLIYILPVILTAFVLYGYSTMNDPRNDAAPITSESAQTNVTGQDTTPPAGFPYPTVWNWNYSLIPGVSGGTVGAMYFGNKYYLNRWNSATLYRYNSNGTNGGPGTAADSNNAYNAGAGAIRDLTVAPDGSGTKYLWGGSASTALYKLDSMGNRLASYTHSGAAYRAIAWDPNRKGFWSCNFGDNIVCRDTLGAVKGTITAASITGKYGMGFDSSSSADSAFLWVWSQGTGSLTNELYKIYIPTGTILRTYIFNLPAASVGIAGGAEVVVKDNQLLLLCNYQNFAVAAYKLKDLAPPPSGSDTALVLIHDTIASTTQRTADKDTLYKYVAQNVRYYRVQKFDTTTTFPDLARYKTIIVQETSFDAALRRYLGQAARTQIMAWLSSGTTSAKKCLITIGADQGYNYNRAASTGKDITFSETYGKYMYRVDDATTGSVLDAVQGVTIDAGNVRSLTSSPPGGGYWPDGCGIVAGGSSILYKYQNGGTTDTLAAIGNNQSNYVCANVFQDPRYYTGGFGNVLKAVIGWVVSNGGVITGVQNPTATNYLPFDYSLSQNYPNPFNPSTKISFSIQKTGLVTLKIFDILGKEVASLVNEVKNAGNYTVDFNASRLSSGVYFYRLSSGNFVDTKKMFLLK